MIIRISRHRSGSVTITESLPSSENSLVLEEKSTTYKDWSEVPDASKLKDYIACECCGAVEMHMAEPLLNPVLSDYVKKLGGHRWCRKCHREHKATKIPLRIPTVTPRAKYAKGMRVFASFGPSKESQKRKAELIKLTERLELTQVHIN